MTTVGKSIYKTIEYYGLRSAVVLLVLGPLFTLGCKKQVKVASVAEASEISMINRWQQAAGKVEETRIEPIGRKASVTVPAELRHYPDRRRFLGVQTAAFRQHGYEIPEDFADLVRLIRQGDFIEVEPLGEHYILYGVGEIENSEALVHYDRNANLSVPLFSSDAEYGEEFSRFARVAENLAAEISARRTDLKRTGRRQGALRSRLRAQISELERALSESTRRKALLQTYFTDPPRRRLLTLEYESLVRFAAELGQRSYDLADAASRREFKVRLLGFARPEAKAVIEQIAQAYDQRFNRHLPVTSLVRTEEYQRRLARSNRNAARSSVPPHTTGLAFDIYYHFMNADEQNELMSEVARLKSTGKVEALRESRDNIHVFAFPDGRAPDESLVELALAGARQSRARSRQGRGRLANSGN